MVQQNPGSAGCRLLRAQSQGAPKPAAGHQPPAWPKDPDRSGSRHRGATPSQSHFFLMNARTCREGFLRKPSHVPAHPGKSSHSLGPRLLKEHYPSCSVIALSRIFQSPLPWEVHEKEITSAHSGLFTLNNKKEEKTARTNVL